MHHSQMFRVVMEFWGEVKYLCVESMALCQNKSNLRCIKCRSSHVIYDFLRISQNDPCVHVMAAETYADE